jgi:hypothetical protein
MLTLEQVIDGLRDRNLRKVAVATGLAYGTVYRIATGNALEPDYRSVKLLSDYIEAGQPKREG